MKTNFQEIMDNNYNFSLTYGRYLCFTTYYPSFGGDVSKSEQQLLSTKTQSTIQNGKFNNTNPVPKELSFAEKLILRFIFFTSKAKKWPSQRRFKVQKSPD
jgi:hypothetical protein